MSGQARLVDRVERAAGATAPKLPLEPADGDDAGSVRARLRERVSAPVGDDGGDERVGHPPGGGGCRPMSSSCRGMGGRLSVGPLENNYLRTHPVYGRLPGLTRQGGRYTLQRPKVVRLIHAGRG